MFKDDRLFIIAPDGTAARTGFFAIRLAKGAPERGLRVMCEAGIWTVYLDAKMVGVRSMVWQQAFGDLWRRKDCLIGREITADEYARLCESRVNDADNGHDLSKPLDLNTVAIKGF